MGTGSTPRNGTNTSLHFTINQPSSINWNWQSQVKWCTVSLIIGVPLVTAIIGLSIYMLRKAKKQEAQAFELPETDALFFPENS
jgi:hypothetical protein